jgi:lipoprotein-releasing system ATP-binding protein
MGFARAQPILLLADEPTEHLDSPTCERVFSALTQMMSTSGLAAIIATHNMDLAARMDCGVTRHDGKVVEVA